MENELSKLINKFSSNYKFYKDPSNSYNEMSCRIEFIDPFLKMLGWDVENQNCSSPHFREVLVEDYSNSTDKPDYTITLRGIKKFFIEAKKPSVNIHSSSSSSYQIRKYGWNAKHKIGILTNFEYIIVYDTTILPTENDISSTAIIRKYHYTEYLDKIEEIKKILSKEVIYSGAFDLLNLSIDTERHKIQVDELFLKQINQWRLEISNYLFKLKSNYRDIEILNDVVQSFINQIVFLRICEDKNLPVYHTLSSSIYDKSLLKHRLMELIRNSDKRFNSGLFSGPSILDDLDNEIIINMIEDLYFPKSPYLFNIIGPSILGKVYEVFLTEKLVISENSEIILEKKKDCVNRSVVSTPTEVVKYMVGKTLDPLCKNKSPNEILKLRIIDIACGSGIFLQETLDYIYNYCIEWYLENDISRLIEIESNKYKLFMEEKKELLISCVFGVDIDIHAVEVAKFSLLLKLIEDESTASVIDSNPILPNLDLNILYGNSLIQDDFLDGIEITLEERIEIAPFSWNYINNGNKFDVIFCNPPYVNTEDMHKLLPKKEFDLYISEYISSYRQFDKYFIFIERTLNLLLENGSVTLIVPNKFYKIESGSKLRELISTHKYLVEIDDFGDIQLFGDKTIYSCILFLKKSCNESFSYTRVKSVPSLWGGTERNSVLFNAKTINEQPWRLTTDLEMIQLINKLDIVAVPLNKYFDIYNGIQTSAERPIPIYWFSNDEILKSEDNVFIINRHGRDFKIEKNILKPYFKPSKRLERNLNTFSLLTTNKWIIFPYNNEGKLISINEMESCFPGTFEYLSKNFERLKPRTLGGTRDVPDANETNWYQYGRTQGLNSFIKTPKIIVSVLSRVPTYLLDNNDMLISSGGTAGYCAISSKPNNQYALEYIQAWLNHSFTEKIIKIIGSDFVNGFTARGTYLLSKLPFIELDFHDLNQLELHNKVVELMRKVDFINNQLLLNISNAKRVILERQKRINIDLIETIIKSIYQSDFKEIE